MEVNSNSLHSDDEIQMTVPIYWLEFGELPFYGLLLSMGNSFLTFSVMLLKYMGTNTNVTNILVLVRGVMRYFGRRTQGFASESNTARPASIFIFLDSCFYWSYVYNRLTAHCALLNITIVEQSRVIFLKERNFSSHKMVQTQWFSTTYLRFI